MPGLIETDGIYDTTGRETIRQQRVVRVMLAEPRHDLRGLRVQDELAALQANRRPLGHASALHDGYNIIKRQMLYWAFLPDVAVLAFRLAGCRRVNHQLRQPLVVRPSNIVQIEEPIIGVVRDAVHCLFLSYFSRMNSIAKLEIDEKAAKKRVEYDFSIILVLLMLFLKINMLEA
jgi:hypothetical protein